MAKVAKMSDQEQAKQPSGQAKQPSWQAKQPSGQGQDQDQEKQKWYNVPTETDSDEEDDEEDTIPIRAPVSEVSDEFRKKLMDLKHAIYDNTVLAPELGSANAQNNDILNTYVVKINKIYRLSLGAQKGLVAKEKTLAEFPVATREDIQWILRWIADFFPKNSVAKTIPYEDFLRNRLHVYPFDQN